MANCNGNLPHNIDTIAEDENEDKSDEQGLPYGDDPRRAGRRRDLLVDMDEDASSGCDTLHRSDEPRRRGAGANDTTSLASSAITAPHIQTPMMPPTPTQHISGTCVINEDDNEDDTDTERRGYEHAPHSTGSGGEAESIEEPVHPILGPGAYYVRLRHAAARITQPLRNTNQDSIVHITDATLAEEEEQTLAEEEEQRQEEVIMGTRLEPPGPPLSWWKYKNAKLTLALFCAALVVLSIALWFAFSSKAKVNIVVQPRSSETPQSSSPSMASSFPPRSSLTPSSPPSMAYVEGLLETDCYYCNPQIAVDGDTAVVARNYDILFFSFAHSSFEIVSKIDIDYSPISTTIKNNTAVIGSASGGAVYIYERYQNGTWSQAMLIRPGELCLGRQFGCGKAAGFGYAIAMDIDVMIVGAPDDGERYQGSVYVYRRNESTWTHEAKLTPPGDLNTAHFGYSVSVKGTLIVVGDPGKKTVRDKKGAAFGYRFDSLASSWNPVGRIQMDSSCDWYSYSVRLLDDEDLLVVCGEYLGRFSTVYCHEKSGMGDEYVLRQAIRFENPVKLLAVGQHTMVVGELRAGRSFAIHFVVQENHVWEEVATIDEFIFGTRFGRAVALSGNITLVASDRNVYQMAPF